jgi:transcriptional regulator with XRE-family HTH domain
MNPKTTNLGYRLKQLRKDSGLSQTDLALKIGVSYSQYRRYELKGVQPPADIINKLADALNTTVDFLLNGNANEKAQLALNDTKLLKQFREAEKLPESEKITILKIIRGYIRDYKTQQAYTS